MALPNSGKEVPKVSTAAATSYVQKLVKLETVTSGTKERAFRTLAKRYGLTASQLVHLYKGKAKKCDVGLYARIKLAYLDRCDRMIAALQHDIAIDKALSGNAFLDQDLDDRLTQIATEVATERAAIHEGAQVK